MKKTSLFIASGVALSFALASCGGGDHKKAEDHSGHAHEHTEAPVASAEEVSVNVEDSKVLWKGEVLGMHSHNGKLNLTDGKVMMDGNNVVGGSFVVDMTTIEALDDAYTEEEGHTKADLIGHLNSPDFFDVANHKTAKFEITSVEGTTATGTLTLRGKTGTEKVENITVSTENGITTATGTLTFDRKKYDVAFDHPVKEVVVSNDIELTVELVAAKG